MNAELAKAAGFIGRLLSNKALDVLTPLEKEEQILQFLSANAQQLFPTLSSPQFFPDKNWTAILYILNEALTVETDKHFLPQLEDVINRLDYTFIPFIQDQQIPLERCKKEYLKFLQRLVKKPEARRAFTGPFMAVLFDLTGRYVEASYNMRQYVYFELAKVQRLRMSKEEIKNMVKASLLLKTAVHLLTVGDTNRKQELVSGLQRYTQLWRNS